MTIRIAWQAGLVLLAGSGGALAVEYQKVLPERSEIRFVSHQMGVPVEGRFPRFDAKLAFDPAKPDSGKAEITLDLGAIDTGSEEANAEARTKGWFDIKNFPKASFVSTSVKPLSGNRYEISGKLSIKGRTREITAPAMFRQDGPNGVMEGSFTLKRLQFGIGEGPWSDVETVADEVEVRFKVTAAPGQK